MDSDTLWETFLNTGRVADYLAYRQSLMAETARETDFDPYVPPQRRQKERRDADGDK